MVKILLWCIYCTKLEPIFKTKWGNEFRHATASAPRQPARAVPPLLLCRTALAYTLPCFFCFAVILIFFFRYGHGVARDGFLLEGETGGIHSVVISFFVVLIMDSVLPNYFLGIWIWQNLGWILPPAERGLGNECGRAGFRKKLAAGFQFGKTMKSAKIR